ncbi:hypothetical protein ECE50_028320 [Chitinophaga sp. Mgbs1]|uniref:Uncharacterized protein n=1 Tax=Chitinophaga solisilvae TaxID=1233460 RepID=A0A9Q5DEU7_9BACT|nr:hypothetical protein [Chitinophaga solisilvae]
MSEVVGRGTADYNRRSYFACVNINQGEVARVTNEHESVFHNTNGDFLTILAKEGSVNEWNWNVAAQSSVYLYSVKDKSKKMLGKGLSLPDAESYTITPEEKFLFILIVRNRIILAMRFQLESSETSQKELILIGPRN